MLEQASQYLYLCICLRLFVFLYLSFVFANVFVFGRSWSGGRCSRGWSRRGGNRVSSLSFLPGTSALIIFPTLREHRNIVRLCTSDGDGVGDGDGDEDSYDGDDDEEKQAVVWNKVFIQNDYGD